LTEIHATWVRIDWIPNRMDSFVESMKVINVKILAILNHNTMFQKSFTLDQWRSTIVDIMNTNASKDVDAWEIWNEPNNSDFYLGYMDGNPQHYTDMLKIAHEVIETSSPDTVIVSAGLSPDTPSWENPDWEAWLKDFNSTSAESFFDYQGVHLYDDLATNSYVLEQTKAIMNKDIWVTEIGQPSAPSPYSTENQSVYLRSNLQMLKSLIIPIFWYQLQDETNDLTDREANFGLFDAQNNPKPASNTFIEFTSQP
jgi:hypothetical protein